MIKLCYFALIRERVGRSSEELELNASIGTISALERFLISRGEPWDSIFDDGDYLVARNQQMTKSDDAIEDGDEIAFFPKVTGG